MSDGVAQGLPVVMAQLGFNPWLEGVQISCLACCWRSGKLGAHPGAEPSQVQIPEPAQEGLPRGWAPR